MYISGSLCAMAKRPKAETPIKLPHDERIVLKTMGDNTHVPIAVAREMCKGLTEPRKIAYILALAHLGNRSRAAQAIGITPLVPWRWRQEDDLFREAYNRAMECAAELMENEMFRRAAEGVLEPVFQGGKLIGSLRKYSDTLLIFGLKGAMPDKYADRVKNEHSGSVDIVARLRAARQRALSDGKGTKS